MALSFPSVVCACFDFPSLHPSFPRLSPSLSITWLLSPLTQGVRGKIPPELVLYEHELLKTLQTISSKFTLLFGVPLTIVFASSTNLSPSLRDKL